MAATPATLILVHGAWHGAWCWAGMQGDLDRKGIPSLAVDLPGHGASPLPLSDLYGDAALVHQVAARIDGPVVLVGHSYGGAVITEAAIGLSNLAHLVYVTAFVLDEGEAVRKNAAPRGGKIALSQAIRPAEEGFMSIDPAFARASFYAQCPPYVSNAATARLGLQPTATFTQPVTGAPWKSTPSTYVVCERDEAIHPETQRFLAARCGTVISLVTDHSPFASMPTVLSEHLARIARAAAPA